MWPGNGSDPQQPASARPEAVVVAKSSGVQVPGAAPAHVDAKAQALTPMPKPEIKFDADHARKNLEEAIQKLNDMMKDSGRTLSFSMDVKLGRPIVFVKNMANGDVVRQIPSEVVVRVAHGIEDFKGMLHNEAA